MTTDDRIAVTNRPSLDASVRVPEGRTAFAEHDIARTVTWLCGEHDISTVDALSEIVARATSPDDTDVELDPSDVQYMGAATIGVIVRTREWLQLRSRSLVLRSPSKIASRLCDLCGLDYVDGRDPVDAAMRVLPTDAADHPVAASGVGRGGT